MGLMLLHLTEVTSLNSVELYEVAKATKDCAWNHNHPQPQLETRRAFNAK
jgi:hypothetical protein